METTTMTTNETKIAPPTVAELAKMSEIYSWEQEMAAAWIGTEDADGQIMTEADARYHALSGAERSWSAWCEPTPEAQQLRNNETAHDYWALVDFRSRFGAWDVAREFYLQVLRRRNRLKIGQYARIVSPMHADETVSPAEAERMYARLANQGASPGLEGKINGIFVNGKNILCDENGFVFIIVGVGRYIEVPWQLLMPIES
jgi:hypothetical protein